MVLLPICSLPHMHSNVLFLSANCVEVRHSRSWNEATSRRRTSQMLRLIPLRPRKVWNRRWYHVGISTMWFCTCTEYRAQYQYMSYYMVRFIYIYIVIVYTVGMGLQHESEFHSPQVASFHQGGSLLHIPKLSLRSLVCMQTFFEAPWVNLFFFLDGFSLHMFLWDVSPCDVFFGFFGSWLLNDFGCCPLCSRLQRGRQLRVPWTSGKKVVLHWADKAMSWVRVIGVP